MRPFLYGSTRLSVTGNGVIMGSKKRLFFFSFLAVLHLGCAEKVQSPNLEGQDLRIAFLHTSDIHSRLLPYRMQVGASDKKLGLLQENEPFGGIARMATVIDRERSRGERVQYVDSGDCFQGAPIFNAFHGEVEIKAMSLLRPDAMVVGNHEYDEGVNNYADQLMKGVTFPVLAANYLFEPTNPLRELVKPIEIRNVDGLKIGYIGVANFSSLSSITDVGTSLQVIPLDIVETVQHWIDYLRPQVDLIVAVSHAGLHEDEALIARTTGLDLVFGGHLHVVLNPPKVIKDASNPPRNVVLTHSGAFAKYVGRLDVIVRDGEVVNHKYEAFPIDSRIPDDALMLDLLEPYQLDLNQMLDLTTVYGFAANHIRRFDFDGGDSPLGNLVAEAIRKHAKSDIGLTNSLGIRTDIFPGPITMDDLFNVFPFNNSITTIYMSGNDVQDLLDYTTRRSAGRGCATQIQVSGIEFTMNCTFPEDEATCEPNCPPRAENIFITNCGDPSLTPEEKVNCSKTPLNPYQIYEVATNDYIAHGGSGFTVLKINNTQVDTGVQLRDAVLEEIVRAERCVEACPSLNEIPQLRGCEPFEACVESLIGYQAQFCEHIHNTTQGETTKPTHCALDEGSCSTLSDCYRLDETCDDGSCISCALTAECGNEEECFQGYCVAADRACVRGRCRTLCETEDDCAASSKTPDGQFSCVSEGLGVRYCAAENGSFCGNASECVDSRLVCYGTLPSCADQSACESGESCTNHRCEPLTIACDGDADCDDVLIRVDGEKQETACVQNVCTAFPSGTCAPCATDSECSGGLSCVEGLCVSPLSNCKENRCRPQCNTASDCGPFDTCEAETCIPRACLEVTDKETACLIENVYKAQAQCLQIPCPEAASDGRIKRVLPPNLDQLPEDLTPDDQEG